MFFTSECEAVLRATRDVNNFDAIEGGDLSGNALIMRLTVAKLTEHTETLFTRKLVLLGANIRNDIHIYVKIE